jgi:hypothetical protein
MVAGPVVLGGLSHFDAVDAQPEQLADLERFSSDTLDGTFQSIRHGVVQSRAQESEVRMHPVD